jgi:hypothetical protein
MLQNGMHKMETVDLLAYTNKDDWTLAKSTMYRCNIIKQLGATTRQDYKGHSMLNVKSGEIYTTDTFDVVDGYLQGQESRPRAIMNPSSKKVGIMAAIQSAFWASVKEACPGFIQGLNKKQ